MNTTFERRFIMLMRCSWGDWAIQEYTKSHKNANDPKMSPHRSTVSAMSWEYKNLYCTATYLLGTGWSLVNLWSFRENVASVEFRRCILRVKIFQRIEFPHWIILQLCLSVSRWGFNTSESAVHLASRIGLWTGWGRDTALIWYTILDCVYFLFNLHRFRFCEWEYCGALD